MRNGTKLLQYICSITTRPLGPSEKYVLAEICEVEFFLLDSLLILGDLLQLKYLDPLGSWTRVCLKCLSDDPWVSSNVRPYSHWVRFCSGF